jgi:hypothetical protein
MQDRQTAIEGLADLPMNPRRRLLPDLLALFVDLKGLRARGQDRERAVSFKLSLSKTRSRGMSFSDASSYDLWAGFPTLGAGQITPRGCQGEAPATGRHDATIVSMMLRDRHEHRAPIRDARCWAKSDQEGVRR